MTRRFVFADAHAGGVPREQRQVYVLVEAPAPSRMVVCREGDEAGRSADLPAEWLEELPPPIPAEPEPGAYLIGETMAVRFPGDDSIKRWAVVDAHGIGGFGWLPWDAAWEKFGGPGVTIRRLVPGEPTGPVALPLRLNDPTGSLVVSQPRPGSDLVARVSIREGNTAAAINLSPDHADLAIAALRQLRGPSTVDTARDRVNADRADSGGAS